ncbi:MAG: 50S ribosomal protein L29 [Gammaproteobacteria bacterium]|nr:50S ribosomal protein L29 [Gammaproteobacteria bacterium]
MKAADLRAKTSEELKAMVTELLREQFNLRMQNGSGQLAKPSQIKTVRRDIARIKTIMKEMETASSS